MTNTLSQLVMVDGLQFQYREDDYVNLSKMCKQAKRELSTYLRSKDTKSFLNVLSSDLQICMADLIQKRVGGIPTEQGTYGHPLIALHLGNWLSSEFAVAVVKLTHQYLKADVSLATNILQRTTVTEFTSEQSKVIGEVLVTKSSDKDVEWLAIRAHTKTSNKTLNAELAQCPSTSKAVYSLSQNAIIENLTGRTITQIKKEKGLTKSATVRETMNTKELLTLGFTEMLAAERISNDKPSGDKQCASVCGKTASMVKSFSDLASGN
jgi:KilA-N domain